MILVNVNTEAGRVELMGVGLSIDEARNLANRLLWAAGALETKVIVNDLQPSDLEAK